MRWTGGCSKPERKRKVCNTILVDKPEEKELLGKNKSRLDIDNKMWRE
jgi:hypothetical protein